jgi:hypothetical protein
LENARKAFAAVSAASAVVVLAVAVWAFAKYPTEPAFGQRFVMDEVPIIPWLGVYFKPVTLMVVFGFVAWACALESLRAYSERMPVAVSRLLMVLFSLVALVFAYEVIWNFSMWSDAHILSPSTPVDLLSNSLDTSITQPRNFTYVTKVDSLYVAISLYSVFFIQTLKSRAQPLL